MLLPAAAPSAPPAVERERRQEPDEDDRPRRKAKKKRTKGGGVPVWAIAAIAATLLMGIAVGGFFVVRALRPSQGNPTVTGGEANPGSDGQSSNAGTEGKYVPRISEQKMEQFLKSLKDPQDTMQITEDQVYALMGQPTRRDPPRPLRKNGKTYTVYTAYWDVPGSGIKSQISFANGRVAGMILGLEVTPPKSSNRK